MNTKRLTGWTALLAIGLAALSCEKEEGVNPAADASQRILFGVPTLSVETRSTFKNALSAGDAFGVLGYCVPYVVGTGTFDYASGSNPWTLKKAQCWPEVFYGQRVVVGTDGCTYDRNGGDANDPKYWYRDGYDTNNNANGAVVEADSYRYSFIAWYPFEGAFTIVAPVVTNDGQINGAPVMTFTMPQTGSDLSARLDHATTPDAMVAVLYDRTRADGMLHFTFSHVLTGLGFAVNNVSERDLTVHSLTLSGSFYKDVTIDLRGNSVAFSFSGNRYTGYYPLLESDLALPAPAEGETATSSGVVGGEHLLLISGTGSSFGENVTVNIDYTFGGERKQQSIPRPGTFTPRPGVKYTAQLNFVGDTFVLQFVVDNSEQWEDGEADDGREDNDDVVFE